MRLDFKDFYLQYVTVHDETASGNVRLEISTAKNLNDVADLDRKNCPINVSISLDESRLRILYSFLGIVLENIDNEIS